MIHFRDITRHDHGFLYELLEERGPEVNISHKRMPTWAQHVRFVSSSPYPFYKIIYDHGRKVGVCYLTISNEIGIFISRKWQRMGYGKDAVRKILELYPRSRLLANISPSNTKSQALFKNLGFTLIQYTYEFMPSQTSSPSS